MGDGRLHKERIYSFTKKTLRQKNNVFLSGMSYFNYLEIVTRLMKLY